MSDIQQVGQETSLRPATQTDSNGPNRSPAVQHFRQQIAAMPTHAQVHEVRPERPAPYANGGAAVQLRRLPEAVVAADEDADLNEGVEHRDETYDGTDHVIRDDDGHPLRRAVGGSTGRPGEGSRVQVEGSRSYGVAYDEETGEELRTEAVDQTVSRTRGEASDALRPGESGTVTRERTRERGHRVEELDPHAMGQELHGLLEERLEDLEDQARERGDDPETCPRCVRLREDMETLEEDHEIDMEAVRAIRGRWAPRALIRPQYRTRSGEMRRGEDTTETNLREGRRSRTVRATSERTEGGTTTRRTRERTSSVDARTLTVERGSRRVTEQEHRGGSSREESASSTSWTASDGLRRTRQETERRSATEGDVTVSSERSRQSDTGAVYDDDYGLGLTRGGSSSTETRVGDRRTRTERSGRVTVHDRRVAAEGSAGGTVRRGRLEARTKVSGDGSFTINLEPQNNEDPPYYLLTFTIHIGAGGEIGGGRRREGDGVGASITARASGSADVSTTRRLSAEEAEQYLGAATRYDRGEQVRGLPEFGRIDRLRAAWQNRDSMGRATAALGDSSAARDMSVGEGTELTLEGAVGGEASVDAQRGGVGGSIDASASRTWRRQVRVTRVRDSQGRDRVEIHVEFTDTSSVRAGGSLQVEAGAGGHVSSGQEEGEAVTVRLDPEADNYDALYQRVIGAGDPGALRRLANSREVRAHIHERQSTEERSDGWDASASGGPLGGSISEGHRHREEVTTDSEGNATHTIEGEHQAGLGLDVGGVHAVDWDQNDSATAEVDQEGVEIDLQQDEAETDVVHSVRETARRVRGRSVVENAAVATTAQPLEHLRSVVEAQFHTLRGYQLSHEDVEQLVARAAQRRPWGRCCPHYRIYDAWRALGRRLARERTIPEEPRARLERNLRVARALVGWVENHGDRGRRCIETAMRHFGATAAHDSRAERLGTQYEWPPSLSSQHTRWERVVEQLDDIDSRVRRVTRESGASTVERMFRRLEGDIGRVRRAVEASSDIESEAARTEMLGQFDEKHTELRRAWARFHASQRQDASGERDSEQRSEEDEDQGSELAARDEQRLAQEQVQRLLTRLRRNKARERRILGSARTEHRESWFSTPDDIIQQCIDLHRFYLSWYPQVQRLREAYQEAGVPQGQWEVSKRPYDPRNREYEPDIDGLIRLYLAAISRQTFTAGNPHQYARDWRQEYNRY